MGATAVNAPVSNAPVPGRRGLPRWLVAVATLGAAGLLGACLYFGMRSSRASAHKRETWHGPSEAQVERDEIFTRLSFAVALKDWQDGGPDRRGFNIGAVLVDPSGTNAVFWARNCNAQLQNATQHAELRLLLGYLDLARIYSLTGHTVYVTLEPCAQCAGMLTILGVRRVVYGQSDRQYGRAFERLQLDTRKQPGLLGGRRRSGYRPYPRAVSAHKSRLDLCRRLDEAYARSEVDLPDFLFGETARALFEEARRGLDGYQVRFHENESALSSARKLLNTVPEDFVPLGLDI